MSTRLDSLSFTTAPVWTQVEQAIWADIRHVYMNSKLPAAYGKAPFEWEALQVEMKTARPKWRALGAASNRPENLEGRHSGEGGTLVVLDESKGVDDEFFESVHGMLQESTTDSLLLAIGTPGPPRGWFYRAFGPDRAHWSSVHRIRATDIPRLQARAADRLKRLGPDNPWYRQQELAEFAGADEFTVLPLAYLEQCIGNKAASNQGTRVLALDPAGQGQDESVLVFRVGNTIEKLEFWQGWDEMKTARYVARRGRDWRADLIAVDAPGLGGPIASRIRELLPGVRVMRYQPGGRPRDREQFANRKAEDLFSLRYRLKQGEISIPPDALLIAQATGYQVIYTAKMQVRIVDPPDSPDRADALNIAFAVDNRVTFKGANDPLLP